ncbi:fluoride efflux transporter FluC [Cellulomonas fimi]|uniref:Fluoride-specific ion channel FluC n=1 Tax=Cellulomonas fimi (strain ATCC 484 / DSM 20113 / JCM 1341 / CCUG 24087 / LMG 16345 / NBRC 15513 / NCIMB 8980 / NCTC 7547 / NRS-133) TaxID=590998 RepID=F4H415_CELFA|nr:CrcB family protein [Cellulomonas fimi]AEE45367.1 Camphor resistance CrcB protein [Cellulomonas fimi ATCC 484]NNH08154.1 CrcB family protein [Cellulomonas fimi]VEH29131.1 camphor resistance protein CrcB [Cellulomonas fimi]
MTVLLVALLGGLGAATRFVVDGEIRARVPQRLPLSTMVVNVSGSLLLGALVAAHVHGLVPDVLLVAAGTGFCGGYTTFSTAMIESVRLLQAGAYGRAAVATVGTLVLAVGAASAGYAVVSALA